MSKAKTGATATQSPVKACKHPPARLFAWTAHDETLCVACCDCGAILKGAA